MKNLVLIGTNVFWKKHPNNERYFYLRKDSDVVLLRVNNFPDEPLFTLINGLDIMDIEDRPSGWNLDI